MKPPKVLTIGYQRRAKYVVADEIEGGMGTVFKLFPVASRSPVIAMKTIRGDSSIQAFDVECEAWISVAHHPNIATPLAFGMWESLPSVLVQWYPRSLAQLDSKCLSHQEIQDRIAETVAALSFAYQEKGLIHQDIKPANILIDESGEARLTDFGLARSMVPNAAERMRMGVGGVPKSSSKELSGTPYFMAPELWNGATPSMRTDIFSLGVTLYSWLTGGHPYVDATQAAGFTNQYQSEPLMTRLSSEGDKGRQVIGFIERCLSIDPHSRYQSYEDIFVQERWLRRDDPTTNWNVDRSDVVARTAQFLQTKNSVQDAIQYLKGAVDKRPHDAVLISALGKLHDAAGEEDEAALNFSLAYKNLQNSGGVQDNRFVPAPALSWARFQVSSGNFEHAAAIVNEVIEWGRNNPTDDGHIELCGSGLHSDIGWYLLYQGEFSSAARELAAYASQYSLDKVESVWAVEAAWLSGMIRVKADELALKLLENSIDRVSTNSGEAEFVWAVMILKQYANPDLGNRMWKSLPSFVFEEMDNLAARSGLPSAVLLLPDDLEKQKLIILEMDKYCTGGAHCELIQSLSQI